MRPATSVSTPIPVASAQNRIDRLVLRLNRGASTSPTVVQPVVITGTPSGSPIEPPLVQTPTGLYDIPVCSWTSTSAGALTGLVDERQYCLDTWHNISSPGWTGVLRVKKLPPSWKSVVLDVHINSISASGGGAGSTMGVFPDPTYYPASTWRGPIAMRGSWISSPGASFAGSPVWAYIPNYTPGAAIQFIIPSLTSAQTLSLDGTITYPLD